MKNAMTILLLAGAIVALGVAVMLPARIGHPVTPMMSATADDAAGHKVKALPGINDTRPMVVVFILPGCPCSEAYEAYTHELFEAFGTDVAFVGVVSGDAKETEAWANGHRTPFPLIADLDNVIATDYQAERSAYTALVVSGTTIKRLWPGYSAGMLRELSGRLTVELNASELPLSFAGAPEALTSGCILATE